MCCQFQTHQHPYHNKVAQPNLKTQHGKLGAAGASRHHFAWIQHDMLWQLQGAVPCTPHPAHIMPAAAF
jgi:hypothetical protein